MYFRLSLLLFLSFLISCTDSVPEFDQLEGASVPQPSFSNSQTQIEVELGDGDLNSNWSITGKCHQSIEDFRVRYEGHSESWSIEQLADKTQLAQDGNCSDGSFTLTFDLNKEFGFSQGQSSTTKIYVIGESFLGKTEESVIHLNFVSEVMALPPSQLGISAANAVGTSSCTPMTVEVQDANGDIVNAETDISLNISADFGGIHSDAACSAPGDSSFAITNGTNSVQFYYEAPGVSQTPVITATDLAAAPLTLATHNLIVSDVFASIIGGQPSDPDNLTSTSIVVGGTGIIDYKYKFGVGISCEGGGYSAERSTALQINEVGLGDGNYTVCIIGKNSSGIWQLEAAAYSYTWTNDTTPPQPEISEVSTDPNSLSAVQFSVDFGESVTGFDSSDISNTGSMVSISWAVSGGPQVYTITGIITTRANPSGTVGVSISPSSVLDLAGNNNLTSIPSAPGQDVMTNFNLPAAPVSVGVTANRLHDSIEVTWGNGGDGTTDYRIAYINDSHATDPPSDCSAATNVTVISEGGINEVTRMHTITGLMPLNTYRVRVCAINGLTPVADVAGAASYMSVFTRSAFSWCGATDSDFHTGSNWLGGIEPGPADEALFDDTSTLACSGGSINPIISSPITLGSLRMESSFGAGAGILTYLADVTVNSSVSINGANLVGSSGADVDFSISTDLIVNGGTYTPNNTAISVPVFTQNGGSVNGPFSGTTGNTWVLGEKLQLNSGSFTANDLNVKILGNPNSIVFYYGSSANFDPGTSFVELDPTLSSGYFEIKIRKDITFYELEVDGPVAGTHKFTTDISASKIDVIDDFKHRDGFWDGNLNILGSGALNVRQNAKGGIGTIHLHGSSKFDDDNLGGKTANVSVKAGANVTPNAGTTDTAFTSLSLEGNAIFTAPSDILTLAPELTANANNSSGFYASGSANFNHNGGTLKISSDINHSGAGDFKDFHFDSLGALVLNNLIVDLNDSDAGNGWDQGYIWLTNPIAVFGNLDLYNGRVKNMHIDTFGNINVFCNNFAVGDCFEGGNTAIQFGDNTVQNWYQQANSIFPVGPILIDKQTSGMVILNSDISLVSTDLTLSQFTLVNSLDLNGYNITGVNLLDGPAADRINAGANTIACSSIMPNMGTSCPFPSLPQAQCSGLAQNGDVQSFDNGMVMCETTQGNLIQTNAASQCASGSHMCSLEEYSLNRGIYTPLFDAFLSTADLPNSPTWYRSTDNDSSYGSQFSNSYAPMVRTTSTFYCSTLPNGTGYKAQYCDRVNISSAFKTHTMCCPD